MIDIFLLSLCENYILTDVNHFFHAILVSYLFYDTKDKLRLMSKHMGHNLFIAFLVLQVLIIGIRLRNMRYQYYEL